MFALKGINFDDINNENSYGPWNVYGQSKLANLLFTYELARRIPKEDNVTVNALHPGIVATELQRYIIGDKPNMFMQFLVKIGAALIRTPEQGRRAISPID